MQVFLPHPSFSHSVACLDRNRLGQQRRECSQILNTLLRTNTFATRRGWTNHPAVRMWSGHCDALGVYFTLCVREWEARGYVNTMRTPYLPDWTPDPEHEHAGAMAEHAALAVAPPWLGREDVHASHRGRLLDKDPAWYGQFGWTDEPRSKEVGYVWPTKTTEEA